MPTLFHCSAFLSATLALTLQFTAPVWALDVQQTMDQQQFAPLYQWAQSATAAELRNLRVPGETLLAGIQSPGMQIEGSFEVSLLHWAAHTGQSRLIEMLLDKGLEPDFPDAIVGTPLIVAARSGQLESVRRLVERGAQPEQILGVESGSALRAAIRQGHVDVARWLVAQKPVVTLCEQARGLLVPVVEGGHMEMVRYLHTQDCAPGELSKNLYMPLMIAAQRGDLPLFQLLLDQGYDPHLQQPDGGTLLMDAAGGGQLEMVEILLKAGQSVSATHPASDNDALAYALDHGHLKMAQLLLARGALLNRVSSVELNPHQRAVLRSGNLAVYQFGLSQGFPETAYSQTQAFASAAVSGDVALLKHLLSRDLDPSVYSTALSPLEWTARGGHLDAVKLLLAAHDHPLLKTDDGQSALLFACGDKTYSVSRRLEIIQALLDHGVEIQGSPAKVTTPLIAAVDSGALEIVQYLVAKGASLYGKDANGATALDHALSRDVFSVFTFLLDQDTRLSERSPEDQLQLLTFLAQKGDLSRVRNLLERFPDLSKQPDALFRLGFALAQTGHAEGVHFVLKRGLSAQSSNAYADSLLSGAATSGNVDLTEFLLSQGAWHHAPEAVRQRAVLAAAEQGHTETLALLLAQESNPAQIRHHQALALHQAAGAGQSKLVKVLLEQGDASSSLQAAVAGGYLAVTQALLATKPSAEALFLALQTATSYGNLPLVQTLLDHGAPVDREVNGTPFVFWLVQEGHLDVLKRIPRQNWPPALPDGTDLLMQAAKQSQYETVAYLVDQGFAPNARTRDGQSALMLTPSPELMRLLVAKGAQVNLRQADGGTALMQAAANANFQGVLALLELGAEVNARKQDGTTALIWAVRRDHLSDLELYLVAPEIYTVVEALLTHGADPSLRDKAGKTALDYAHSKHLPEVVELLTQTHR